MFPVRATHLDCVLHSGGLVHATTADGEAALADLLVQLVLGGDEGRLDRGGSAL